MQAAHKPRYLEGQAPGGAVVPAGSRTRRSYQLHGGLPAVCCRSGTLRDLISCANSLISRLRSPVMSPSCPRRISTTWPTLSWVPECCTWLFIPQCRTMCWRMLARASMRGALAFRSSACGGRDRGCRRSRRLLDENNRSVGFCRQSTSQPVMRSVLLQVLYLVRVAFLLPSSSRRLTSSSH